jgi:chemotaxis protein methyltransferase WspC
MTQRTDLDALLAERIGLDPGAVGASLVARGLQARMTALGMQERSSYEALLGTSADEVQELIEEIVVPESWFFRDDRPFAFLRQHVRLGWLNDPARPPMRLLSLPCARGEEPYSIAITLLDLGLPAGRFQLDAVDISQRCLARARRGLYGRNAFRGDDAAIQARYFRPHEAGFELLDAVRGSVRFLSGNLVDPSLLAGEPPYDVIFCRNLLIYLTDEARARASANLIRLLASSGILFLGHAERLEVAGSRLIPVGDKGSFAYRRETAPPAPPGLALPAPVTPPGLTGPPPARPNAPARPRNPSNVAENPPAPRPAPGPPPAPPAPRRAPPPPSDAAAGLLDQAAELADQGRYDEAVALCERSLRESGPSARGFFLLGMIRQAAGDREQAEASFQKTLYLDAQHDEALLALALLAERRGDGASAVGYRRRAERAVSRKGAR